MKSLASALLVSSAAFAAAQSFNTDVVHTRVFNDAPGSNLTVTNTFPGTVEFNETNLYNASGYANRHIWNYSADGTTDANFGTTNYWDVSFGINLSATEPTGQNLDKEAGFILQQDGSGGGQGDSQFIVKSDGEVAMFGGSFTFHQFMAPNIANDYKLGSTGQMELKYFNNGSANMLTASWTYNGLTTSFTDATTIYQHTHIGGYAQYQITNTSGVTNTGDTVFSNVNAVPEPGSFALLGFGALAFLKRRRR